MLSTFIRKKGDKLPICPSVSLSQIKNRRASHKVMVPHFDAREWRVHEEMR